MTAGDAARRRDRRRSAGRQENNPKKGLCGIANRPGMCEHIPRKVVPMPVVAICLPSASSSPPAESARHAAARSEAGDDQVASPRRPLDAGWRARGPPMSAPPNPLRPQPEIDGFRAKHLHLVDARHRHRGRARAGHRRRRRKPAGLARAPQGPRRRSHDQRRRSSSPANGCAPISPARRLTPRVTSNWEAPTGRRRGGGAGGNMTDLVIAARQRVRAALDGLRAGVFRPAARCLLFPARARGCRARARLADALRQDRAATGAGSAGAALRPGADRAVGKADARLRSWLAEDAGFRVE